MKRRVRDCTFSSIMLGVIICALSGGDQQLIAQTAATSDRLRQRFFDRFYFQGRIAESISPVTGGRKCRFADQTIYMGQALMVFSLEMQIRRRAGKSVAGARKIVKELLDGIEQLERAGNRRFNSRAATPDGLFVRDDIRGPNDPRLYKRFKVVESDAQNPGKENDSPSGDQIFGLMSGLYCVVHYSDDKELSDQAKKIASRLFEYARRTDFILRLPNGKATRRGSDVRWLASLLHGLYKGITGNDRFRQSKIKIGLIRTRLNGVAAFWDSPKTAETMKNLVGKRITIPLLRAKELHSFALHIALMALAPSKVWSQQELEGVAMKCNHHAAVLFHCLVHKKKPNGFKKEDVEKILAACPAAGPRAANDPRTGWHRDNRWIRCTEIFKPRKGSEEYNGLDWLLLHNLKELVY